MQERVCFVTGAARGRGNGRSIALALARTGCAVAVADILDDQARTVAEEIAALGKRALSVKIDLSDYDQVSEAFDQVKKELGPIDILVNNAAIMDNMATISAMPREVWDKEIAVNLSGAFYCVKQVFDDMVARKWGRIINITSVVGMMGGFGQASYSASKAGLVGLTKTIALEGARFGVTANAVTLGVIATDAYLGLPEKIRDKIIGRVPVRREGAPEEVGAMVAFLASEESAYITGANLTVSGGMDLFTL